MAVVSCLLQTSVTSLKAVQFEAEGLVTSSQIFDGKDHPSLAVNSQVFVDGCRYSLRMTHQPKRVHDYQEVARSSGLRPRSGTTRACGGKARRPKLERAYDKALFAL